MAKSKKSSGTIGKGGVRPAPNADNHTVRVAAEQLVLVPIDELIPYANNAKVHTPEQINQIRGSLREFGFVTPVLIDFDNNIIAGHGRVMAARAEGMTEVPCVMVSNLSDTQRKAYILADNRMSEIAQWDLKTLEVELEGLRELDFNDEENDKNLRELRAELPNYVYPDCVVSVGVNKLAKWGQPLKIMAKDTQFIRALDAQKEAGKAIFGGGFLLSEKAAAEKAAAEKAAAEKAAAEKTAATEWSLSEREQLLVQQLGKE